VRRRAATRTGRGARAAAVETCMNLRRSIVRT
jgi:hypothetical protein